MNVFKIAFLSCLILGAAIACVTTEDLTPEADGTTVGVEGRSYDDVWAAANAAVTKNLKILESTKDKGVIKAENGMSLTSNGELVAVFVQKTAGKPKSHQVKIISKTKSKIQLTGTNWEQTVAADMRALLKL